MSVSIFISKKDLISKKLAKNIASRLNQVLKELRLGKKEVSLTLVDNLTIWNLNLKYLGRNYPTNVLSFSFFGKHGFQNNLLGEIIISVEKAKEEADFHGLNFENYLLSLVIHGLVHLLDYDHEKGIFSPWLMLKKEIQLFEKVGFSEGKEEVLNFLKRREYMPAKLAVNVDHVATVREARKAPYPDPVHAAVLAELGGADGIVVHLRLDRRHIKERDVRLIKEVIKTKLILEMAIDEKLIKFAKEIKPYQVTLVPERTEEITTEGGMDLIGNVEKVKKAVKELNKAGIKVSLFLNPDEEAIKLAKKTGAQIIEIHTGMYAEAEDEVKREEEFGKIEVAARLAKDLGFIVHAGHGLSYENIGPVAAIPEIEEFSIGHSIVSRAIMVGMKEAVREMKELIWKARG
ncbi:pyridoxine 5'-phosphate synthase [Thermodesulfobacterium commune]|uniref:Multifunctional fusion protein n=1 Tax=Thermodesulfobacterium commune DSM 2178 TaxID=289377 RepID=A0A075WQ69_9BACT|nr:pyridoxine 5'-phosphate synthase [Thermodesulfobacterium commune]AIH03489.1 metalloprotease [Thermodesulfobacterium commune DSM 2178]